MTFLFSIFLQLVSGYTAQEAGLLLIIGTGWVRRMRNTSN